MVVVEHSSSDSHCNRHGVLYRSFPLYILLTHLIEPRRWLSNYFASPASPSIITWCDFFYPVFLICVSGIPSICDRLLCFLCRYPAIENQLVRFSLGCLNPRQ
ncbi:unnamed protein product [Linum tenue]|uniref:Uncharacterized protein n=1 Tax=Linum tenue TaxID=586396 RepID=A0AAV0M8N6_9ROSI|nr:unnamed protein product [Linum tenue]